MRVQLLLASLLATQVLAVDAPRIVAVPPVDGGRGLVRVSEDEIRHYPGKDAKKMLVSKDNGETWKYHRLPKSYPLATCTGKEAPSIVKNPVTGEFLRVEKTYNKKNENDGLYITEGGLDGEWKLVTDKDGKGFKPYGLLRTPIWVKENKRILIPGHGGGCWTWYSDDQGMSWERSNKVQSPHHKIGGIHKATRWNHGMVEATVIELKNKKLWMIGRTAQDQHYESFSRDYGKTWSEAKPSRFWGTITMPTFYRMEDGRILFLWSNTTSLPERETAIGKAGEDAFTNRDTIHAAISEDEGETWIGFRELILDEHRNLVDYGTRHGSEDRGKHQSEVVQLDENRVLYSCGQHKEHRRLMIMDVRWLYEKESSSDISKDGAKDWTTHQYIKKYVGHCAYNRTEGPKVKGGALRLLRVDDETLDNPNQGATWNFPAGDIGRLTTKVRLEKGGTGLQIALCDRWFNASDETVDQFANYVLNIDADGKYEGKRLLQPGKVHELSITWKNVADGGTATLKLDGKKTNITLDCKKTTPNGVSYVHFYNPAEETDSKGVSILEAHAQVK